MGYALGGHADGFWSVPDQAGGAGGILRTPTRGSPAFPTLTWQPGQPQTCFPAVEQADRHKAHTGAFSQFKCLLLFLPAGLDFFCWGEAEPHEHRGGLGYKAQRWVLHPVHHCPGRWHQEGEAQGPGDKQLQCVKGAPSDPRCVPWLVPQDIHSSQPAEGCGAPGGVHGRQASLPAPGQPHPPCPPKLLHTRPAKGPSEASHQPCQGLPSLLLEGLGAGTASGPSCGQGHPRVPHPRGTAQGRPGLLHNDGPAGRRQGRWGAAGRARPKGPSEACTKAAGLEQDRIVRGQQAGRTDTPRRASSESGGGSQRAG